MNDACLLFALARESHHFRRSVCIPRPVPAPCRAWSSGPPGNGLMVLETGVGAARTEAAVGWLLSQPLLDGVPYRPRLVISAGFAGALDDSVRVGAVLLATEVVDPQGNRWPTSWPDADNTSLPRGRLLTMPHLVADPAAKRRLGREYQAPIVDMESATLARLCAAQAVPFGCVRAVSDAVTTALSPALVTLLAGGRVAPLRVLAALLARPRLAGELWRLARDTRRASRRLGQALVELLTPPRRETAMR